MDFCKAIKERNTEYLETRRKPHRGHLLQFALRQEKQKAVHLAECRLVPGLHWAAGTHNKNFSPSFYSFLPHKSLVYENNLSEITDT